MNSWNDWFNAKTNDYIEVKLSAEEINAVEFLAKRIAASKKDEDAYKKDGIGIEKRYLTGLIGEYAVVKVLSDWGLCKKYNFYQSVGASYDFNIPDLIEYGFGMGCKTCGTNRNVKVKENEVYPEIISVYDKNKSTCTICGIATPEIINKYSSPDLITEDIIHVKDGKVTAKVGFNRFDLLLPFTLDTVMKYKSNLDIKWYVGVSDKIKATLTTSTTYVSTMHEISGYSDYILGRNGSIGSNTNGKHGFVLDGIEIAVGGYEVAGNAFMDIVNASGDREVYYTNDSTKLTGTVATAKSTYEKSDLVIRPASLNGWKYITEYGFDTKDGIAVPTNAGQSGAGSAVGYADALNVDTGTSGQREFLLLGNLSIGTNAGLSCVTAFNSLTSGNWYILARLSINGVGGELT